MQTKLPVLIVGAGPTGLTLAVELSRYGIPYRIIDKTIKPVITSNALAVHARTLEIWDEFGILTNALESGIPLRHMAIYADDKKKMAVLDMDLLHSRQKMVLALAQHDTEKLLIEKLRSEHIIIEMETELTRLTEVDGGVEAILKHGGETETVCADWLIACDGIHSAIREMLDIAFKGQDLPQHFLLADAEIESELPGDCFNTFPSENGAMLLAPYKTENKQYWRMIIDVTHDPDLISQRKLTLENVNVLAAERCPFRLSISEPVWSSGFTIHERMAQNFRHNHVFLAGDAAHVHSPAGGQGMNIGISDAYNLAWKLALVIQGKARLSILDTYNEERVPVAKVALRGTTMLTRFLTVQNDVLIKFRNLLFRLVLSSKKVRIKIINILGGLDTNYKKSALTKEYISSKKSPAAGTLAPDVELHSGERLREKMRGTRLTMLIFMGIKEKISLDQLAYLKEHIDEKYSDKIESILVREKNEFENWQGKFIFDQDQRVHNCYAATRPMIYLVRPDQYICFRGRLQHIRQLEEFIVEWFI